jgi:hypothetical protein
MLNRAASKLMTAKVKLSRLKNKASSMEQFAEQ